MVDETDYRSRVALKAHKLFMQYGIRSVSMDEIAESIGSSKKTLYQYFKDKDSLVMEVLNNLFIKNADKGCEIMLDADNAIHECFLSLEHICKMYQNINMSVLNDLKKYHPSVFRQFVKFKQETLFTSFESNIKRGIEEGLYRDDINIDLIAWYRVDSIFQYFNPDLNARVKIDLLEYETQICFMYLHGLSTAKGQKLITKFKNQLHKNTLHAIK